MGRVRLRRHLAPFALVYSERVNGMPQRDAQALDVSLSCTCDTITLEACGYCEHLVTRTILVDARCATRCACRGRMCEYAMGVTLLCAHFGTVGTRASSATRLGRRSRRRARNAARGGTRHSAPRFQCQHVAATPSRPRRRLLPLCARARVLLDGTRTRAWRARCGHVSALVGGER